MYSCLIHHNGVKYQVDVTDNEKVAGVIYLCDFESGDNVDIILGNKSLDSNVYLRKRTLTVARNHLVKKSELIDSLLHNRKGDTVGEF